MKLKPLVLLGVSALLLAGCGSSTTSTTKPTQQNPNSVKLVVNELPLEKRPFVVMVPHASNHLFTLYVENANQAKGASVDLEYQSGDLLKGVRTSLDTPIKSPYTKAVILGSCSTGGKCSFDGDLKSGTMKFKLDFGDKNLMHVLKGDFTFVSGQTNLPDGKFSFEAGKKTPAGSIILTNSFGLPKPFGKDIQLYPVSLATSNDKKITGKLSIKADTVSGISIFDGSTYQPLKYTFKNGEALIDVDMQPRSIKTQIIRDDQKGATEDVNLFILGPIVVQK